jgi:2-C-methyl-D-erythritol 2,4-cyclodiphosphate synthase
MLLSGIGYDVHALVEGRPLILGGIDIGHHFPNTDESIRGMRSTQILAEVAAILAGKAARIINIDATVIAEAPKIAPHLSAMRTAIAEALQMPMERVSIKATTNEGLGFLGRAEGIAALAIASVDQAEFDPATAPPLPAVGL